MNTPVPTVDLPVDDSAAGGQRPSPPSACKWKLSLVSVLISVLALAGLFILMYPSTASWWASYHQSKALMANHRVTQRDEAPGNAQRLADAHRYNDLLQAGEITIGAGAHKPTTQDPGRSSDSELEYQDLLSGTDGMMARIRIPRINVDLPVYHGTSDGVLLKGAGHLEGTALPVGGTGTRSVISAHRGLASATMFNNLDKLQVGDRFVIEVLDQVLTYQVLDTQVVPANDTETVLPREGEDLVTLVTCTPLGINTHRILVTGQRVTPTPIEDVEAVGEMPDVPGFPWWAVILPTGFGLAGLFIWRAGYAPKPR